MLGMAIDVSTQLVFVATDEVDLESRNFLRRVRLDPSEMDARDSAGKDEASWGRYVRASLETLRPHLPDRPRGFTGIVAGGLPGSGLSSSASVLLAYFSAWAEVNSVSVSRESLVELAVEAENRYVGVQCGVLDPASIVHSRRDHLLSIDARTLDMEPIPLGVPAKGKAIAKTKARTLREDPSEASEPVFVVVFTGTDRSLLATPFNDRVEDCFEAARWVADAAGEAACVRTDMRDSAERPPLRLGDLDARILEDALDSIPDPVGRRARHFVEERARVHRAEEAWRSGDLGRLGELMSDSCRSSIENYETGSEELIALQKIWLTTPGVLGARFSGGGFGGCSLALVEPDAVQDVMDSVSSRFAAAYPALRDRARTLQVKSADGLVIR